MRVLRICLEPQFQQTLNKLFVEMKSEEVKKRVPLVVNYVDVATVLDEQGSN